MINKRPEMRRSISGFFGRSGRDRHVPVFFSEKEEICSFFYVLKAEN